MNTTNPAGGGVAGTGLGGNSNMSGLGTTGTGNSVPGQAGSGLNTTTGTGMSTGSQTGTGSQSGTSAPTSHGATGAGSGSNLQNQ